MEESPEYIKQQIVIELEHARAWSAFLLPGLALALTLLFTNAFFDEKKVRVLSGAFIFIWTVFVFLMRNDHIKKAISYCKKL
jgi:hypothetical protein